MNDNQLIAEFMGEALTFIHDNCGIVSEKLMRYDGYYHEWNNLMPVVEKIQDIEGLRFVLNGKKARIYYAIKPESGRPYTKKVWRSHTIVPLNSTYNVVIDFIKWYNQNKS